MLPAGGRPPTSWVHYITSCNTKCSAPEDGQNNCPKHVELTGIINKPLLLHLVGCLYYLYQWYTVKQISDNEIYLLFKYIKSVLWRVAKCLSYIEEARCLEVNANITEDDRKTMTQESEKKMTTSERVSCPSWCYIQFKLKSFACAVARRGARSKISEASRVACQRYKLPRRSAEQSYRIPRCGG